MKKTDNLRIALTALVLVFLFGFAADNIDLAASPTRQLISGELTFETFVDKIQTKYVSHDLEYKNDFVNLNGLFARLTGRRVYNNVVCTENGMLTQVRKKLDMTKMGNAISEFSAWLEESTSADFLYVQAPSKEDYADDLFPTGVESYANENADELLAILEENGVEDLDLRPLFCSSPEQIETYFYSTDHHWTVDAAFLGFQTVAEYLAEAYPDSNIDLTYTNKSLWESHTLENWFLGSQGKRVGLLYEEPDDFTWYTPSFETQMSLAVRDDRELYTGDFTTAYICDSFLDEPEYFTENTYAAYMNDGTGLVQHRNASAASDLKILLIKDSFSRPVQCFLSTLFQEIDAIDPRYFGGSIAAYVEETQPDLVIMLINPSLFSIAEYRQFDIDEVVGLQSAVWTSVYESGQLTVKVSDTNKYNRTAINLEYGTTYHLTFDDVSFTAGTNPGIVVDIQDTGSKETLNAGVFDIEYCRQSEDGFTWIFTTPESGEGELELRFFAGIPGETIGVGVVYENILLETVCGISESTQWTATTEGQSLTVEPSATNSYNRTAITLEYGAAYTLTFDGVTFTEGQSDTVTVDIQDTGSKEKIIVREIDLAQLGTGGFAWTFQTPESGDGPLELRFFAGAHGETLNIGVVYENVTLIKANQAK